MLRVLWRAPWSYKDPPHEFTESNGHQENAHHCHISCVQIAAELVSVRFGVTRSAALHVLQHSGAHATDKP